MPTLFLASSSPRRAELLQQIGVPFQVCGVAIDESWPPTESLTNYVGRLSREKAQAAAACLPADSVILAADTAGICGDMRLVKPTDKEAAVKMLQTMSGNSHIVSTAISVYCNTRIETRVVESEVFFRHISTDDIHAYWASGEPCDKAGSYAIQGMGAIFVEKLHGSYSGVVGLPLYETANLLQQFGIHCWQPRR